MSIKAIYFECNYILMQFKQPILCNMCITTQKSKRNEKLTDYELLCESLNEVNGMS